MQSLIVFALSFAVVMTIGAFLHVPAAGGRARWRPLAAAVAFLLLCAGLLFRFGLRHPLPSSREDGASGAVSFPPPPPRERPFLSASRQVFVWIPPGSFTMGSEATEPGRNANEGPRRTVRFRRGFWMASHETTTGQVQDVLGETPEGIHDPREAASELSWNDALAYCHALTRRDRAAERIPATWAYSLPTEDQWEYACRAGVDGPFNTGATLGREDAVLRLEGRFRYRRRPEGVTGRRANAWGLHDMHGNVAEWCLDGPSEYGERKDGDEGGRVHGRDGFRAVRGGSWADRPADCRSAARAWRAPDEPNRRTGFRPVLGPSPPMGLPPPGPLADLDWSWSFLVLLPGLVWGVRLALRGRRRHLNRIFARFAHLYKGEWEPASTTTYPRLRFPYRGLTVEIDYFRPDEQEGSMQTVLTADLRDVFASPPPRLEVSPRFFTKFRPVRFRGLSPWEGASKESPLATLNVLSDDHGATGRLLCGGLEGILVELGRLATLSPCTVSLHPGRLEIKKLHALTTMGQLRSFTALALRFVDLLVAHFGLALPTEDFEICDDGAGDEAIPICGVCGEEIAGPRHVCLRCESPHHPECWTYNGLCSTFACGCESYREDVRTGTPPPRAAPPRDDAARRADEDRPGSPSAP